jgi:hypothetical protein
MVPPICLAREAVNLRPDPCLFEFWMPHPLSDTVKRASPKPIPPTNRTLILPPTELNACLMLFIAVSFRMRPTDSARSILNSSSSHWTSTSTSSTC